MIEMDTSFIVAGDLWSVGGSKAVGLFEFNLNGDLIGGDTLDFYPTLSSSGVLLRRGDNIGLLNLIDHTPPFNGDFRDLEFSIFSEVGTEMLSQEYGGSLEEFPSAIKATEENEIIICGSTDSFGDPSGDIYLIKIDTIGNIIWENNYGGPEMERAFSFNKLKDGNYLISGDRRISGSDWDIYLVKTDSNGNLIWDKYYGGPFTDYAGRSIELYDHSIIVARSVDNGSSYTGYIEKLDGNGDLIWSLGLPFNGLSYGWTDPIENFDGTITIGARIENSQNTSIEKLIKITPLGDTIWTKEYFTRPDLPQTIYNIKATTDGGYIMCGSAFPDTSNIQSTWVIKTNCLGEEGTQYPISGLPCDQYDCSLFPIDASFTSSTTYIDLAIQSGLVTFENNSSNATSRVWNFGDGTTDYTDSIMSYTYTQPGIYDVELIVFHGMCSDTVTQAVEVVNTSGVMSPNVDYGVSVYPNPSSGSFVISFKNAPNGSYKIIDLAGRIHRYEKLNGSLNYSVNHLEQGAYLLQIDYPSGVQETVRVVVK